METIANRIVDYLDTEKMTWNDVERMQMVLGLQVLIHNIIMTGTILISAALMDMFWEAFILLATYGILKMTVGGVHFQTSSACLIGTGTFVMVGVMISRRIDMSLISILMIYAVCFIVLPFKNILYLFSSKSILIMIAHFIKKGNLILYKNHLKKLKKLDNMS